MNNPLKSVLNATAAIGLSVWFAGCSVLDKGAANDTAKPPVDPHEEYRNPNAPFPPSIKPSSGEPEVEDGDNDKEKQKKDLNNTFDLE